MVQLDRNVCSNFVSRYESTLQMVFGWNTFFVCVCILHLFYQANIEDLRNWQSFWIAIGICSIIYSTTNVGCNYLWTDTLGFFPPIPFGGFTIASIAVPPMVASLWFMIPKSVRKEKELKKKFIIFLVSRVYEYYSAWLYVYFTLLFIVIPSEYQPILGFVCALLRNFNQRILNIITYRAGGGRHTKMGKFL